MNESISTFGLEVFTKTGLHLLQMVSALGQGADWLTGLSPAAFHALDSSDRWN